MPATSAVQHGKRLAFNRLPIWPLACLLNGVATSGEQ
jgi:hypothetical protein